MWEHDTPGYMCDNNKKSQAIHTPVKFTESHWGFVNILKLT